VGAHAVLGLVDADFLDTEAFMDAGKATLAGSFPTLRDAQRLRRAHGRFCRRYAGPPTARRHPAPMPQQGSAAPGLYTLTVPTGGGKTLASLGFALDHALPTANGA
jgi:CRISPR-associated endonuclease/helicase Cas3